MDKECEYRTIVSVGVHKGIFYALGSHRHAKSCLLSSSIEMLIFVTVALVIVQEMSF